MHKIALVLLASLALVCAALPGAAQESYEPARGSELRADLMSALRPHAEWAFAAPVQFIIHDLRISGDVAFASISAQRPDGSPIDLHQTPLAAQSPEWIEDMDGATLQALLEKSGRVWVAVHHEIGATDAWWDGDPFCAKWGVVMPGHCQPGQ
ncbi:MAG: hypothetical protein ACRBBK_10235 [Paracoccaceae bacterium]